jgi:hypothetical protein
MIKIHCDCGKVVHKDYYEKHILSLIHKRRMLKIENNKFTKKEGK